MHFFIIKNNVFLGDLTDVSATDRILCTTRKAKAAKWVNPSLVLQVLSLSECRNLTSIKLRTPALESLLANLCASVHQLEITVPMPRLLCMNFMGCMALPSESLTNAFPHMTRLKQLNVAGCLSLTKLVIPRAFIAVNCT